MDSPTPAPTHDPVSEPMRAVVLDPDPDGSLGPNGHPVSARPSRARVSSAAQRVAKKYVTDPEAIRRTDTPRLSKPSAPHGRSNIQDSGITADQSVGKLPLAKAARPRPSAAQIRSVVSGLSATSGHALPSDAALYGGPGTIGSMTTIGTADLGLVTGLPLSAEPAAETPGTATALRPAARLIGPQNKKSSKSVVFPHDTDRTAPVDSSVKPSRAADRTKTVRNPLSNTPSDVPALHAAAIVDSVGVESTTSLPSTPQKAKQSRSHPAELQVRKAAGGGAVDNPGAIGRVEAVHRSAPSSGVALPSSGACAANPAANDLPHPVPRQPVATPAVVGTSSATKAARQDSTASQKQKASGPVAPARSVSRHTIPVDATQNPGKGHTYAGGVAAGTAAGQPPVTDPSVAKSRPGKPTGPRPQPASPQSRKSSTAATPGQASASVDAAQDPGAQSPATVALPTHLAPASNGGDASRSQPVAIAGAATVTAPTLPPTPVTVTSKPTQSPTTVSTTPRKTASWIGVVRKSIRSTRTPQGAGSQNPTRPPSISQTPSPAPASVNPTGAAGSPAVNGASNATGTGAAANSTPSTTTTTTTTSNPNLVQLTADAKQALDRVNAYLLSGSQPGTAVVDTRLKNRRSKAILEFCLQVLKAAEGAAEITDIKAFKGTVTILRALLDTEVKREENSEEILALYQIMANMVYPLGLIKPENFADEELAKSLENIIQEMEVQVLDFGNLVDFFYKKNRYLIVVRIIRAAEFRKQLEGYSKSFVNLTGQLNAILHIHNTGNISLLLERSEDIINRLGQPDSIKERQALEYIKQLRPDRPLTKENMEHVAHLLGMAIPESAYTTLGAHMKKLLEDNGKSFEAKLEDAKNHISSRLDTSTLTIMTKLNEDATASTGKHHEPGAAAQASTPRDELGAQISTLLAKKPSKDAQKIQTMSNIAPQKRSKSTPLLQSASNIPPRTSGGTRPDASLDIAKPKLKKSTTMPSQTRAVQSGAGQPSMAADPDYNPPSIKAQLQDMKNRLLSHIRPTADAVQVRTMSDVPPRLRSQSTPVVQTMSDVRTRNRSKTAQQIQTQSNILPSQKASRRQLQQAQVTQFNPQPETAPAFPLQPLRQNLAMAMPPPAPDPQPRRQVRARVIQPELLDQSIAGTQQPRAFDYQSQPRTAMPSTPRQRQSRSASQPVPRVLSNVKPSRRKTAGAMPAPAGWQVQQKALPPLPPPPLSPPQTPPRTHYTSPAQPRAPNAVSRRPPKPAARIASAGHKGYAGVQNLPVAGSRAPRLQPAAHDPRQPAPRKLHNVAHALRGLGGARRDAHNGMQNTAGPPRLQPSRQPQAPHDRSESAAHSAAVQRHLRTSPSPNAPAHPHTLGQYHQRPVDPNAHAHAAPYEREHGRAAHGYAARGHEDTAAMRTHEDDARASPEHRPEGDWDRRRGDSSFYADEDADDYEGDYPEWEQGEYPEWQQRDAEDTRSRFGHVLAALPEESDDDASYRFGDDRLWGSDADDAGSASYASDADNAELRYGDADDAQLWGGNDAELQGSDVDEHEQGPAFARRMFLATGDGGSISDDGAAEGKWDGQLSDEDRRDGEEPYDEDEDEDERGGWLSEEGERGRWLGDDGLGANLDGDDDEQPHGGSDPHWPDSDSDAGGDSEQKWDDENAAAIGSSGEADADADDGGFGYGIATGRSDPGDGEENSEDDDEGSASDAHEEAEDAAAARDDDDDDRYWATGAGGDEEHDSEQDPDTSRSDTDTDAASQQQDSMWGAQVRSEETDADEDEAGTRSLSDGDSAEDQDQDDEPYSGRDEAAGSDDDDASHSYDDRASRSEDGDGQQFYPSEGDPDSEPEVESYANSVGQEGGGDAYGGGETRSPYAYAAGEGAYPDDGDSNGSGSEGIDGSDGSDNGAENDAASSSYRQDDGGGAASASPSESESESDGGSTEDGDYVEDGDQYGGVGGDEYSDADGGEYSDADGDEYSEADGDPDEYASQQSGGDEEEYGSENEGSAEESENDGGGASATDEDSGEDERYPDGLRVPSDESDEPSGSQNDDGDYASQNDEDYAPQSQSESGDSESQLQAAGRYAYYDEGPNAYADPDDGSRGAVDEYGEPYDEGGGEGYSYGDDERSYGGGGEGYEDGEGYRYDDDEGSYAYGGGGGEPYDDGERPYDDDGGDGEEDGYDAYGYGYGGQAGYY